MTSKFAVWVKKFAIPVLFLVISFVMLFVGIKENQGTMFMVAAFMMMAAGVLSILYSTGKLKTGLVYGIGGITGIAAMAALFFTFKSCKETQIHDENYEYCKKLAIQNLMDIREIQKIHRDQKGVYAGNWNEFESFLMTATVPYVKSVGTVPSRPITIEERDYLYTGKPPIDRSMTEVEAWKLSKWKENPLYEKDFKDFVRDTIQVSLLKTRFIDNRAYKHNREVNNFPKFSPDSLKFIPYTNAKETWLLEVRDSVKFGESVIPTIRVSGYIPFAEIEGTKDDREEIYFGNLLTNSLDGSWEQ